MREQLARRTFEKLPAIRMALDVDGETIGDLVRENGFKDVGIDWSHVYPYWLVAEYEGEVVGCIQVRISIPIGGLEMLSIKQDLNHTLKSLIVKSLLLGGSSTLKQAGASMAAGLIPFEMKSYKKLLKRRGCVSIGVGNEMARRL